jgi:hypothetical protein
MTGATFAATCIAVVLVIVGALAVDEPKAISIPESQSAETQRVPLDMVSAVVVVVEVAICPRIKPTRFCATNPGRPAIDGPANSENL